MLVPITFGASSVSGTKIHALSPARAACAATAVGRVPVEAQPIGAAVATAEGTCRERRSSRDRRGGRCHRDLNKKAPAMNAAGGRFLAPCLTWRQYAANHHGNSCRPQDSLGSGEVKPWIGAGQAGDRGELKPPVHTLKRVLGE